MGGKTEFGKMLDSVFVVPPAKIFVRRVPETLRLSSSCSGS